MIDESDLCEWMRQAHFGDTPLGDSPYEHRKAINERIKLLISEIRRLNKLNDMIMQRWKEDLSASAAAQQP